MTARYSIPSAILLLLRTVKSFGRRYLRHRMPQTFNYYTHNMMSKTALQKDRFPSQFEGMRRRMGAVALFHAIERNLTKPSDYCRQMCYKNVSNSNISIPLFHTPHGVVLSVSVVGIQLVEANVALFLLSSVI